MVVNVSLAAASRRGSIMMILWATSASIASRSTLGDALVHNDAFSLVDKSRGRHRCIALTLECTLALLGSARYAAMGAAMATTTTRTGGTSLEGRFVGELDWLNGLGRVDLWP